MVEEIGFFFVFSSFKWCTDNGVMVVWIGCECFVFGFVEVFVDVEFEVKYVMMDLCDVYVNLFSRWSFGEKDARATGDIKSGKKVCIVDLFIGVGYCDSGIVVFCDVVFNNFDD